MKQKLLGIINWRKKMGLVIIVACFLGILVSFSSSKSYVKDEEYNLAAATLDAYKRQEVELTTQSSTNNSIILEYKKSPEFNGGK